MTISKNAEMLDVPQVAKITGVSKMSIYRLIHDKELRAYRVGRQFRVRRDDLEEFLRNADTFASGTKL